MLFSLISLCDPSVLILLGVLGLTAFRQVGSLRLQIWQIMTLGAILVLLFQQISPELALGAINIDIMIFLFGAFCIGEALNMSGYLAWIGSKVLSKAKNTDQLVYLCSFLQEFCLQFL
jgi:Na+/H+ antiporter NhaD/arsenite permease-like protein